MTTTANPAELLCNGRPVRPGDQLIALDTSASFVRTHCVALVRDASGQWSALCADSVIRGRDSVFPDDADGRAAACRRLRASHDDHRSQAEAARLSLGLLEDAG